MSESHSTAPVEYRQVPGFPLYRVGDDGSVWSKYNNKWGIRDEWKRLRGSRDQYGYLRVHLRPSTPLRYRYIHHLVLELFVGPCPDGFQSCHKNDVKNDNRLSNLRWGTPSSNKRDAYRNGCLPRGERHGHARLKDDDIPVIVSLFLSGLSPYKISKKYAVTQCPIHAIIIGKTWKHIPRETFDARSREVTGRILPVPAGSDTGRTEVSPSES